MDAGDVICPAKAYRATKSMRYSVFVVDVFEITATSDLHAGVPFAVQSVRVRVTIHNLAEILGFNYEIGRHPYLLSKGFLMRIKSFSCSSRRVALQT